MNATILLDHDVLEPTRRTGGRQVVRALLRVTGTAPEDDEGRVPLNLSVVLDRSGSMSGEKLAAAKDASRSLVRRLWPEDVVSVVAYDHRVRTVAEPGTGSDHPRLSERIAAIEAGGSTNLSGGWLRGRELAGEAKREEALNRVVLLSDGLANQGITDHEKLCGLCAHARRDGITTTTIGFGGDFDERLLRGMADAGGGHTYYIERPDQAGDVFGEELEGLLELAAQNLSVEVRPGSAAEVGAVHHSYPRTPTPDGLRLELGDLYAREPRELLLEFGVRIPERAAPRAADAGDAGPVPVAKLVVEGDALTGDGGVVRRTLALPIVVTPGEGPSVEPEVRRQVVLLEAARAREEALEARREGDLDRGGKLLREAATRLERYAADAPAAGEKAAELAEEARELEAIAERFDGEAVSDADAKYMYQRAYDAGRGRWKARKIIERKRKLREEDDEG